MRIEIPKPHIKQQLILDCTKRFIVVMCGRRFGKSELSQILCLKTALDPAIESGGTVAYITPTYKLAKTFFEKLTTVLGFRNNISNLKIGNTAFSNDKESVELTETTEISAVNYGNLLLGKMMFAVNAYNQYTGAVKRIRNRKNSFEIQRGFYDRDEIAIALPQDFLIEFLPINFELKSKFGEYKTEFIKKDGSNLVYKRSFYIKKGMYSNTEYDEYRLFIEQVSKNDNAKIILTKI